MTVSVDFDQDFEGIATRLRRDDGLRSLDRVDQNFETAALITQCLGPAQPVRRDADRVENVVAACGKKLLGFAQGRNGDAVRACGALSTDDSDAFGRLDVGTETDAQGVHPVLHARDIALHARDVDDGSRRFDI